MSESGGMSVASATGAHGVWSGGGGCWLRFHRGVGDRNNGAKKAMIEVGNWQAGTLEAPGCPITLAVSALISRVAPPASACYGNLAVKHFRWGLLCCFSCEAFSMGAGFFSTKKNADRQSE